MEELSKFTHIYEIDVRFSDFDIMGHINNTRFITFLEDARVHYLENLLNEKIHLAHPSAIVAHVSIDFKEPVEPGKKIEVYTRCAKIGNKSMTFEEFVVFSDYKNPVEKSIATKSTSVIVSYDYKKQIGIVTPEKLIKAILDYEKFDTVHFKEKVKIN